MDRRIVEQVAAIPDAADRLQAAADHLWDHPATPYRSELAQAIVRAIYRVSDAGRQIELSEAYLALSNSTARSSRS